MINRLDLIEVQDRLQRLEDLAVAHGFDGSATASIGVHSGKIYLSVNANDKDINTEPRSYVTFCDENDLRFFRVIATDESIDKALTDAASAVMNMPDRHQRELNILSVKIQKLFGNDQQFSPEIREKVMTGIRVAFDTLGLPLLTHGTHGKPLVHSAYSCIESPAPATEF